MNLYVQEIEKGQIENQSFMLITFCFYGNALFMLNDNTRKTNAHKNKNNEKKFCQNKGTC